MYLVHLPAMRIAPGEAFSQAFSVEHLAMALYFILLGMTAGILHGIVITRLRKTRERLTRLEMILPICAQCKKIRISPKEEVENPVWLPVEEYFRDHHNTDFTHTFCNVCAEELYGEYLKDK